MNDKRTDGSSEKTQTGGVIQTWIDGGLDTMQAALDGSIQVLDQSRTQLTERVAHTLDWAEGFPKGAFAVARQLNRGVDTIAAQSIGTANRVGCSILDALRRAGHGARNFASDTSSSLIGQRMRDGQTAESRMTA